MNIKYKTHSISFPWIRQASPLNNFSILFCLRLSKVYKAKEASMYSSRNEKLLFQTSCTLHTVLENRMCYTKKKQKRNQLLCGCCCVATITILSHMFLSLSLSPSLFYTFLFLYEFITIFNQRKKIKREEEEEEENKNLVIYHQNSLD